jgi:dipeptidyl aminopeptidase/acylaminoacyl peptidase
MKTFRNLLIMAIIGMLGAGCAHEGIKKLTGKKGEAPITKPEIQLEGGRLTAEGLWAMGRIGSAQVDRESGRIAYTVSYYSVAENRSTTWIRIMDGADLKVLDEFVGSDPIWLGESATLAYLRDGKLYLRQNKKDKEVEGVKELQKEGTLKDIEGFLISPKRNHIILVQQVKTVPSTADKYPDLPLATGHIHQDLMYKHWDEWTETAPQPFLCDLNIEFEGEYLSEAELSNPQNMLEGTAYECPMKPFGGVEQLAWSPDGNQIAYTCRKKTGLEYAVSTNSDIYLFEVESQKSKEESQEHTNLTAPNGGYDTNPSYSPNGEWIAWQSMERDGYESDENRLMVKNRLTGELRWLTRTLQSNVEEYAWLNDTTLLFTAVWQGTIQLYRVTLAGEMTKLTEGQHDLVLADLTESEAYVLGHSMQQANEIYSLDLKQDSAQLKQLTWENKNIYDQIEMGRVEPRWQKTSDGKQMLTWIIYPPKFDPEKKYPTLLYCEGGPQSPVSQFWSFRWNFMMMSAHDYIIVAPNRRGLPGFGNAWNEQISGDYGGQCMRDLLAAIDQFKTEPYVDQDHLGCVGASFGGYSVYWLAGHHDKRFKAFIAHDGIFNLEMQYLETEEKWFANWDMGGAYWDKKNATAQRTFQNSPHRFVDKWDTPILCIHGEKDYRILANQAMAAFDAAQMRGVPSELLIFPDENHWVLSPQNGILWQRTFFEWLDRWLKE